MKPLDIIVAGLGAMGSASLYQLSKTNLNVLGIDRYDPPHEQGSSHGETRITRSAVGEGDEFVPLVICSNEIWRELSKKTGKALFKRTGGLIFSSGKEKSLLHAKDIFNETIRIARENNISHEILEYGELCSRFPNIKFESDSRGYFEHDAGYLKPELCIEANLEQARKNNAVVNINEEIISIDFKTKQDRVIVTTDKDSYISKKIVLTVGPWVNRFLKNYNEIKLSKIYRQPIFWFEAEADYSEAHFPVFIKAGSNEKSSFYGFPALENTGSVKFGLEQFEVESSPENVSREISKSEIDDAYKLFSKNFYIRNKLVRSQTCLYTVAPDYGFTIDFLPGTDNVLIVSPCSGHGFKHSAGIGLLVKQLVINEPTFTDTSPFGISRF